MIGLEIHTQESDLFPSCKDFPTSTPSLQQKKMDQENCSVPPVSQNVTEVCWHVWAICHMAPEASSLGPKPVSLSVHHFSRPLNGGSTRSTRPPTNKPETGADVGFVQAQNNCHVTHLYILYSKILLQAGMLGSIGIRCVGILGF